MALTELKIRNTKANGKVQKLYDERGLLLYVTATGGKYWRFKYRFDGKERQLAFGVYPDINLISARDLREEARQKLAHGIDPNVYRKIMKSRVTENKANTFEAIAREWFAKSSHMWVDTYSCRMMRALERDIFPWLGAVPINGITAALLLKALRRVEERGAIETAHRTLGVCNQILGYAVVSERIEFNPVQNLRRALSPSKTKHFAAQTDPKAFGALLRILDNYEGTLIVRSAIRLAPLVFVRPGELRTAQWADIDFEKAEWRYLVTKTNTPHIVPLSRQALDILQEIYPLTGRTRYVFPNPRTALRPMSDNAILAAFRRSGISKEEASCHGFRATARTLLDEVLGFRPDFIEHQLAHVVKDPNGRAYNRTAHLVERKKMMQAWADYLDELKAST